MKFLLCMLALSATAFGQLEPCGLRSMTEMVAPIYPPIAKAAHVSGMVIVLAEFDTNGQVIRVDVRSGPEMLKSAASTFVKSWQANEYTGPRTCPVVITYELESPLDCEIRQNITVTREDLQHVTVHAAAPMLCDPAVIGKRKKHFFFFF